ncbi:MAG: hypothetical protein DYH06_21225, partial [Acidobacteria bacterium ACB2]|nr:hypothetical protein [Acidobacteria bacterium ACB2]
MWRNLQRSITDAFGRLLDAFLAVIPALLVLLASLVVGVLVGLLLRAVLLAFLKLLSRRGRVAPPAAGSLLKAAGVRAAPERVAGVASFWTAVIVSLAVGVNALEPGALRNALSQIVAYVPALLTATLLFVIGLGLAALARRSVLIAAVNAGLPWARP